MAEYWVMNRATVTRLDGAGAPYVDCPQLGGGEEIGPCDSLAGVTCVAGDQVLVASVGGVLEDLVVVGTILTFGSP